MTTDQLELNRQRCMDANGFGPRVMMGLKVCSNCGTMGTAHQFFCRACGHRLPRRSLYYRYREKHRCCPGCGTVVKNAAQYCPQCGEQLRAERE